MKQQLSMSLLLVAGLIATSASASVATFDDLSLPSTESHYAPQAATNFISGAANFIHNFTNYGGGCCWSGFTYSNMTDTTTAGYINQYSAVTGGGVNGSTNYAISNPGSSSFSRVNFATSTKVTGAYFTNTTYAYLSMLNGDSFAKKFALGDFLTLTVSGLDSNNQITNAVNISLARDANLLHQWVWDDLTPLGKVNALEFSLSSSDVGAFGMNTPAYFAMDNLTTIPDVPLPAAFWLFGSGLLGLVGIARRRC